jgi:alginate O-acetyltransferase complex protein AlgI
VNGLALPIGLAVIVAYWRWPTAAARRTRLLIGTLVLTGFLTWQFLPGFDQRPLDRIIFALGFVLANLLLVTLVVSVVRRVNHGQRRWMWLGLAVLIGLFILSKWTAAWLAIEQPVAALFNQPLDRALPPAAWLGLSYLLFRLLHLLLEARKGQLPDLDRRGLIIYALFPAALIAGPIDRWPRFKSDLDRVGEPFRPEHVTDGVWRILIGAFKKFVIADYLAQLPIDLAAYPHSTPIPILWLALYGYGLMLYFDFSGYTDMAIGAAQLIGFHLPENFDRPYLKTNLARFWQAWHITLSSWARDYVFFPLARTLRSRVARFPANAAALLCHLTTMIVIGVWHGFAWTFVAWGVWHGLGLFAVKVWGDFTRPRHLRGTRWTPILGLLITLNFVMLGWVFFGAPDLPTAIGNFGKLFGIR